MLGNRRTESVPVPLRCSVEQIGSQIAPVSVVCVGCLSARQMHQSGTDAGGCVIHRAAAITAITDCRDSGSRATFTMRSARPGAVALSLLGFCRRRWLGKFGRIANRVVKPNNPLPIILLELRLSPVSRQSYRN